MTPCGVASVPTQPPARSPRPGRTFLSRGQAEANESGIPRTEIRTATLEELRPNRSDPDPVVPGAGEADSSNRPCRKSQNRGALARRVAAGVRSANRLPFLDSVLRAHAMEIFA